MHRIPIPLILLALISFIVGCDWYSWEDPESEHGECSEGETECESTRKMICEDGQLRLVLDCADLGKQCRSGRCEEGTAVDGDAPPDGDTPIDGDESGDGDEPGDGDDPGDGDENDGDSPDGDPVFPDGDRESSDGDEDENDPYPIDFGEGRIVGHITTPVNPCRGLAYDGSSFFIGDIGGNRILKISPHSGDIESDIPSPANNLVDLAYYAGTLYSVHGSSNTAYLIDPVSENATLSDKSFGDMKGITYTGDDIATWEGNRIELRNPGTLLTNRIKTTDASGSLLAFGLSRLFAYKESTSNGSAFTAHLQKIDNGHTVTANVVDDIVVPINAQSISGMTASNKHLWLLTTGSGPDSNRIIEIVFD